MTTLGDGSAVDVSGSPVSAADGSPCLPVVANGQSSYVPTGYVATGSTADTAPANGPAATDADASGPSPRPEDSGTRP